MNKQYNWQYLAFCSLVGFVMAAICLVNLDPKAGIAAEDTLLEATGKVAWIEEYKYGTRFRLAGISERFDYLSKAKGMGAVRNALNQAGDRVVSIRYERKTHGPVYSDDRYHNVWELTVGDRAIRTYAASAAAWESDNRLVPWLGSATGFCGLGLGYAAWRMRRTAQQRTLVDDPRLASSHRAK
ncbi:hypothetical protein [Dokdonella koreensis]|uniref:hypothetical protein n=1 Tax=Dokdonella koreensis TaxID=323415 RepID=UPI0012376481|nr:hypothetical protein [Dokdonella koreensis]